MTIWAPVMFRDELDMLECRLEALEAWDVTTVIVEAPITHRGVPKPLYYAENADRFKRWADRIVHVKPARPQGAAPWEREHNQRQAAWPVIAKHAELDDVVLICDTDEIPSPALLSWTGPDVVAAYMKTTLFAVDWLVPGDYPLPPTCVAAMVSYLHQQFAERRGLGAVRDGRSGYPVIADGGWHFSWTGGPARHLQKLETATCHTEIIGTPEGDLIASGERWRTGKDGGGQNIPVTGVDVDATWPAYVYERRCPAEWFRPRHDPATERV